MCVLMFILPLHAIITPIIYFSLLTHQNSTYLQTPAQMTLINESFLSPLSHNICSCLYTKITLC